jgi:predicted dehydrogenase
MSYSVAVIGCGGISARHLRAFGQREDCKLIAVADVRLESAERRAAEFGVAHVYSDYQALLVAHRPDIVSVNTWPGTHAEITIAAARSGATAVLCEKPVARSLQELEAMLAACGETGTKLAVGHHQRFERPNVTARRLIAEGRIGTPLMLRVSTGGGLLNNGSHALDRMRFLLGDPKALWVQAGVQRRTDRYERGEPCEDSCLALVVFENGCRALLECDLPGPDWATPYTVFGSEGTLRIGETLELMHRSGTHTMELDSTRTQHEALIRWIEGGPASPADATVNRGTVELEMAAFESARIRGPVQLPLASGPSPLVRMIEQGSLPVEVPGRYDIRAK